MILTFQGKIWYWRGPSPYHFVTVPEPQSSSIKAVSTAVSYGWGCIPVIARIGDTQWKTSLFPQKGGYIVPLKDSVRAAQALELEDEVTVQIEIRF